MFMLLPFRPVTRGRLRRARLASLAVFLGALAVYALTTVTYAFPGASASLIAFVAGLDVIEVPERPLLRWLGGLVASLPYGTLPWRLNLCSALAGALTLAWIYKIVWFFVFENMREESAVTRAFRISRFAAWCAVAATGSTLAFWYASTRFNSGIFDVLLVTGCLHMICLYGMRGNRCWPAVLGVAAGLGAAESALFIVASPLLLAALVIIEWKQSWYRISRLTGCGFLAALSYGVQHWFSARQFLLAAGEAPTRPALTGVVVSVFRQQVQQIQALLPPVLWFYAVAFGAGFAAITLLTVLRSLDNRRNWMLFALKTLLTLLSIVIVFNLALSVWQIETARGVIPVFSAVLTGVALALLAASWRAQAVMDDPRDEAHAPSEDDASEQFALITVTPPVFACLRVSGVFAAPLMVAALAAAAVLNLRSMTRDDGGFMDAAADRFVADLKERRWVVTNGVLDSHLLIAAARARRDVVLLAPFRVRDRRYLAHLRRVVQESSEFSGREREWAVSLLDYNLHMFINDFFLSAENIGSRAVCMGLPDIWYESGKVPVPEILFYGGADALAAVDPDRLLASYTNFFATAGAGLCSAVGGRNLSGLTRRHQGALKRHLAFVANNLGVVLDELERPDEAFHVYERALELNPQNVSAMLNRFEMVSRGFYPEKRDLVEKQVNEMVRNTRDSYPLWAMNRYFGYVRNYDLFVNMGWEWAVSSSPGSVIAGLRRTYALEQDRDRRRNLTAVMAAVYEMQGDRRSSRNYYEELIAADPRNALAISGLVRLSLQDGGIEEARQLLEQGRQSGVAARNLRRDWAALYLMAGDLSMARATLQSMADEPGADPMTVAMLAMVMIEQGEYAAVEANVLPRLAKMEDSTGNYFVNVIQGRILQMKGRRWFAEARKKFQRAFIIRPDVAVLREVIFRLDVALGDRRAAEAHAIEILRSTPNHPLANFFMGSVALEEGNFGRAEDYLRVSVEAPEPTVEALNNYAQLLCRIRRSDEAVAVARRASLMAPQRYEVWSTLAYILQESGSLAEASQALARASDLNKTDKRLFIIDGLIALKRGDLAAVSRALNAVGAAPADLPATSRQDLQRLTDALAGQR